MARSYTGRKRFRRSFGHIKEKNIISDLISIQKDSYRSFVRESSEHSDTEGETWLESIFKAFFPVVDENGKARLEFCGYQLDEPQYSEKECRQRGGTYSSSLRGKFRLIVWEVDIDTGVKTIKDIKEQDVYLGDIPLMTERGTFIFNGIERVIVSQMHRSPGIFFDHDHGKTHTSGKVLYSARIIPYRGSWIDFEFDHRDAVHVRIDRKRKFPVSVFLMCLDSKETEEYRKTLKPGEHVDSSKITGMSKDEIYNYFYEKVTYSKTKDGYVTPFVKQHWRGANIDFDITDANTKEILIKAGTKITMRILNQIERNGLEKVLLPREALYGKFLAETMLGQDGTVIAESGTKIDEEILNNIEKLGKKNIPTLFVDYTNVGPYIMNSFELCKCKNRNEALLEMYKALVPGEVPSIAGAENMLYGMLFDHEKYDFSAVGRAKFNDRLGLPIEDDCRILRKSDILLVIKTLLELKDGNGEVDDIDNLGNRRIRSVGELIENQCRMGMLKMERSIREKMATTDVDTYVPSDLINAKPLITSIRDFFVSSQLSQFMDQTNPLSEVTHKRRLSALGPGGLSRERAGFEVRDVHPTHYSRLCPIETPEGQNIGLINSLASYARINKFGFIEAPYKKVVNGKITDEIVYMTATEEYKYSVGQADIKMDENGNITEEYAICRYKGEVTKKPRSEISFVDVSPKQVVSVAAALIPFLENDDASRALMGSNMQRQAVPLVKSEAPLVGTGMESIIARDSGTSVIAKHSGIVDHVDAQRIVIRVDDDQETGADVYNLLKFQCSNMNTCINQRPLVKVGEHIDAGDIIADGQSIDCGELALGKNMLVAFMSWNGYSFEDSIILSERVVQNDDLTSIHIEGFEIMARDTKLGNEEITRDIPNVSDDALRNLDESGIVYVGAEVKAGDILVGKVTPKGETAMTPEGKLLRAIFGEKSSDVRDTSFRVPPGVCGTVIDVKVLLRRGVEKDERSIAIERQEIESMAKDMESEKKILEHTYSMHIKERITGKTLMEKAYDIEAGTEITTQILDGLSFYQLRNLVIDDKSIMKEIHTLCTQFDKRVEKVQKHFEQSVAKLRKGDDLPPGVLKLIKVYVANKRKIQPGDKMAGRHGNKGVVSKILPVEDMPYLEDGTPVDIILNPLGLPSRMNVGQILETHLGAAAKGLGNKINKALDEYRAGIIKLDSVRDTILNVYPSKNDKDDVKELNDKELLELADNIKNGVPVATPVFDGAHIDDIEKCLEDADLDKSGQVTLYDGRTGLPFDRKVTVGIIYMLKLHHLVDDKMHARSVGPYSLITQQPLGGKAQFGGQRFGEMEVWALEAYGAAYILQEMLTIKSDDIVGRTKIYGTITCDNANGIEPGLPESFNVLVKELQALGLNVSFEKSDDKPVKSDIIRKGVN